MDINIFFDMYNLPKDKFNEIQEQFKDIEDIKLKEINDKMRFEIYKILFKRIGLFLKMSKLFEDLIEKDYNPQGVFTKKELKDIKRSYKENMRLMSETFKAAGLEGDWILRKIVGSKEKMQKFKEKIL